MKFSHALNILKDKENSISEIELSYEILSDEQIQQIADELWDYHIETSKNTIEVYINFLRKKLEKDSESRLICTKIGYGYYLNAE